jgi:hypothetical protein
MLCSYQSCFSYSAGVVPKVVVPRAFEMVDAMDCASCVGSCWKRDGTITVDRKVHFEDGLGELSAAQSTVEAPRVLGSNACGKGRSATPLTMYEVL